MNIAEFARKSGFSTATVSRAFHEPDKLKQETCEHILALARKLGYYPNPSGRALVTGKYNAIGLIWPLEVEGPEAQFASRVIAALTAHLVENDLDLLICPLQRDRNETVSHAERTIRRSCCDAWIVLYPRTEDPLADALQRCGKPVISFLGQSPAGAKWKSVQLNQAGWIRDALHRLKNSGSRKVLFFGGRGGESDHLARLEAFQKLAPEYFGTRHDWLSGRHESKEPLAERIRSGKYDAIIGVDDAAALLALEICHQEGIAVPGKMRLVGIDDTPEAMRSSPALSSYRQPLGEMLQCAIELAMGVRRKSKEFEAEFVGRGTLAEVRISEKVPATRWE